MLGSFFSFCLPKRIWLELKGNTEFGTNYPKGMGTANTSKRGWGRRQRVTRGILTSPFSLEPIWGGKGDLILSGNSGGGECAFLRRLSSGGF